MATAQKLPRIINGVNVKDLFTTIDAIKGTPSIAKFKFRIRNQWLGASQNRSTVSEFYGAGQELSRPKPFVLEADEPAILLGKDAAANPVEHLLHALASCVTTSMVYHAAARGISIEEVESSFEGDIDLHGFLDLDKNVRKGYQGIRVNFKIKADVPDEQLQEIVELGAGHSPVFDSLTKGVPVSVNAKRLQSLGSLQPTSQIGKAISLARAAQVSPMDGGRESTEENKKEKKTMPRITNVIHTFTKTTLPLALLISFVTASPLFAQDSERASHRMAASLVEDVREATRQFIDVNNAGPAGYSPAFGCVSGPDHGAMGIHYVNGGLVGDGQIDVTHPEALIYEPVGDKRRLVGVEYIVDAATWLKNNNNTPPSLDGQDFQFVAAPNRFNLADFFELHVWAWRDNPQGAFVDWNNHVTCENQ